MVQLMVILFSSILFVAIMEAFAEVKYKKELKAKRQNKELSDIPFNADETISDLLHKEHQNMDYKLAVLVVEDEFGNKTIEDMDLRGDSCEPVNLSEFKFKKNFWNVDKFFMDFKIINAMSKKLVSEKRDTDSYYAFEITKENIMGGRHGKQKKKIVKDYVQFFDLSIISSTVLH